MSPYQKSKCFYCNRVVSELLDSQDDAFADVDHFFALSSINKGQGADIIKDKKINANGVWNLVIACKSCNRGEGGKFEQRADKVFYEKLLTRNRYFLEEHKHSLKDGVCTSLNVNSYDQLTSKMMDIFKFFEIQSGWKPPQTFHTA